MTPHEWARHSSDIEDARDAGDGRTAMEAVIRAVADGSPEAAELRLAMADILSGCPHGAANMRRALEVAMEEHFDARKGESHAA